MEIEKIKKSLIAFGLINIDIITEVTKEFLENHGYDFKTNNFKERDINFINDLEKLPNIRLAPGGCLNNTLRVIKWILNMKDKSKQNYKISIMGLIGDEEKNKIILNELDDLNINHIFEIKKNSPCSRCGVGIYNNERYLLGEDNTAASDEFMENNFYEILNHEIVVFESFMIEQKFNMYKKISEEFNKKKSTVIFALCADFIIKKFYDKIVEIGNNSDIIFSNLNEIKEFAKQKINNNNIFDENNDNNIIKVLEISHKILKERNRILITTCGNNPVLISKFDYKRNKIDFILKSFPSKIPNNEIVDTNGAGDSFLAGFIAGYMQGKRLEECCKMGNLASEVILKNIGCTFDKNVVIDFD